MFISLAVILTLPTSYCLNENEKSCEAYEEKCVHVTALVPARSGSKGIKNKNLSRLGNETLLARTLRIINDCGKFDSVWVSTDGKAIADEAASHGAKVHWRSLETGTDNASTISVVNDFLRGRKEPQVVAVIQCTSPFLRKDFLCRAFEDMMKTDSDCLFSVTRSHQLRWTANKDGFVSPINFDAKKRPRRQDWQGELVENGMFYFAKRKLITEENIFQNERCKTFEIPKHFSLEIDTEFDLMLARTMLPLIDEISTETFLL